MPIKTKILKILPIWLTCLIVISAIQPMVFLLDPTPPLAKIAAPKPIAPEVLGAATSIRGSGTATTDSLIKQISQPDLSGISSKSFVVFDLASGQNLVEKNPDDKLSVASLTKLLTALVAYQNINLNQTITITPKDLLDVKPNLGFAAGEKIKALDIFNAMLVGSCNDAALALANHTAAITGQEFVSLMNQQAAGLGMLGSKFSNPMGFDSVNNYSTASDIKTLISAVENLAVFKDLGRKTTYSFTSLNGRDYSTTATNTLLKSHPELEAIKTGYTAGASGAMATKISLNGNDIVILVLDSQDRAGDTLKLENLVVSNFQ